MFDALAGRYDLMNDVLSMGQVRLWRKSVQRILQGRVPATGCSTSRPAPGPRRCPSPRPAPTWWPVTFPSACSRRARPGSPRATRCRPRPGAGSPSPRATRCSLPFRDGTFDAVTISFGLRNVHGTRDALAEMRRVTRPGGRLVVCEFSTITIEPLDMLYRRYLTGVLPAIARRAARNPEAYEYLSESINDWPSQRELADVIRAAGWSAVKWRDLSLGVVSIHVGRNP